MGSTVTDHQLDALGDILLRQGHCDQRTLERARRVATDSEQRLDSVLIQLGLVSERGLADAYADLLSIPVTKADRYPAMEPVLPQQLGPAFLRHARAVPLAADRQTVLLAAADPLDPFLSAAVAVATNRAVQLEVAVPIELETALNRLYPEEGPTAAEAGADAPLEEDAERLKDLASEAPVIRLVNLLITRAVETQASDIHIEPFEDRLRVRYRYDGVLHEAEPPPRHLAAAITSRIKIMARLDIAERRIPQDGRIKMAVRGQDVDFRVSTVPSLHGETVVLRILDRSAVVFDYARLGLAPMVIRKLGSALDLPNGIVLVTGPTGSGKTTTLYTGLLALNAVTRKIVTVEDPIEYQLQGINQIQVRSQIGLTFASLLRSILRQDPDVIMVGEIRDGETAQIAVQAALTGHLVLSTLHTNSAAAAVTRLRDMGVEDYLLTAVLRGIMAQRLVRRLCPECRRPEPAAPELVQRFGLDRRATSDPIMLSRAVGCPACRQTGYRGRTAIAEFLEFGPEIERLIFSRADHATIERAAVAQGMEVMFDAGLAAALAGETTIEELTQHPGGRMTTFRYTAIGAAGERLAGVMDAASEAEVIARLQRQGTMPIRAELADKASRWGGVLTFDLARRRGLRKQDVADLIRELATMLTAGQDLDRALRYMQETAPQRVRATVTGLRDAVRDGSPLSVAMTRYPGTFPAMHVGLVRAGEAGGNLGPTLSRIADLLDRQRALASTITSAMIYPTVLFVAMIGAVALLLTQVLPQFVPMFEQSGATLPPSTQFLISAGQFVADDGLLILLALLVLLALGRVALGQPRIRLAVDRLVLRLPVIGTLTQEVLAARFTRVLGTLLGNGVALIPALAIVRDAMGNLAARTAVEQASITARGGGPFTRDLEAAGVLHRAIHLLRLGEETAQLAAMALRAADIHEEKTRLATQRLTALLVPAMTILMGVAVGGIVASLMTAMLSLNNLASG